ncbi:RecX family transcriptional regulator [bacterium]|nr:RecX family transcriptional regulator [bacterium]
MAFSRRPGPGSARPEVVWTPQRAIGKLLERLGRSELSSRDALNYLLGKGCPDDLAQTALKSCQERSLVDDQRLSGLLSDKAQRVGWSQKRLRQEEYKKGLSPDGQMDDLASCQQLAQRWLQRGVAPDKVAARLQRRGFSYAAVRQAVQHEDPPEEEPEI